MSLLILTAGGNFACREAEGITTSNRVAAAEASGVDAESSSSAAGSSTDAGRHAEDVRTADRRGRLRAVLDRLPAIHKKLETPRPGDWLNRFGHLENGQTFSEYVRGNPTRPTVERHTLYVQPLGVFRSAQRKIVEATAEFMGLYFNLPVKTLERLPLSAVNPEGQRRSPHGGQVQLLTSHVLDKVLRPQLPNDAAAMIAFTSVDLYAGADWNFVFGEADLSRRVGIWSIYRFGNPAAGEPAARHCLERTLKVATHETGHMFGMHHCIRNMCNMAGSNGLAETDRHPMWLCPNCLAKVCHATNTDPLPRFRKLAAFTRARGLDEAAAFYERSAKLLASAPP